MNGFAGGAGRGPRGQRGSRSGAAAGRTDEAGPDAPAAERPNARAKALTLLARREHSTRELTRKLVERGVDAGDAVDAIAALAGANLQSDERFAEALVRRRVEQGYGPRRIAQELSSHGVAAAAQKPLLDAHDWRTLAIALVRRKLGNAGDRPARLKAGQWLERRGFAGDDVRAAVFARDSGDED